jgi:hypothetical protein
VRERERKTKKETLRKEDKIERSHVVVHYN